MLSNITVASVCTANRNGTIKIQHLKNSFENFGLPCSVH